MYFLNLHEHQTYEKPSHFKIHDQFLRLLLSRKGNQDICILETSQSQGEILQSEKEKFKN